MGQPKSLVIGLILAVFLMLIIHHSETTLSKSDRGDGKKKQKEQKVWHLQSPHRILLAFTKLRYIFSPFSMDWFMKFYACLSQVSIEKRGNLNCSRFQVFPMQGCLANRMIHLLCRWSCLLKLCFKGGWRRRTSRRRTFWRSMLLIAMLNEKWNTLQGKHWHMLHLWVDFIPKIKC